ncbi:MAG: transglycosylase SLT domain-containing protein [Candidatus Acidiferrales bacterium]
MSSTSTTRDSFIALARAAAAAHSLDPALVCAVVEQESAWNPWAIRYEPGFLARYVAPLFTAGKLSTTEAYARSFSWGLMQVMGQVAREHGFGSPSEASAKVGLPASSNLRPPTASSVIPQQQNVVIPSEARDLLLSAPNAPLSQLCDPSTGLEIGCRVLAHKFAAAVSSLPTGCEHSSLPTGSGSLEPRGDLKTSQPRGSSKESASGVAAFVFSPDITAIERALQLWNGGANPDYAAQVLARLPRYAAAP